MNFGFYGKLPAQGDFVARNLPRAFVSTVDRWIQDGLSTLQSTDANWLKYYLVAPVWRFVLPQGVWRETGGWCGAIMPSVDAVGRYFPMVVAAEMPSSTPLDLYRLCGALSGVAAEMPRLLKERLSPEDWLRRLEGLQGYSFSSPTLPEALTSFLPSGNRSIWWAETRNDAPFLQMTHRGEPDIDLFQRLFRGDNYLRFTGGALI